MRKQRVPITEPTPQITYPHGGLLRIRWEVRKYYRLNRIPTEAEAMAEVENLERKRTAGTADDMAIRLWAILAPYYNDGR